MTRRGVRGDGLFSWRPGSHQAVRLTRRVAAGISQWAGSSLPASPMPAGEDSLPRGRGLGPSEAVRPPAAQVDAGLGGLGPILERARAAGRGSRRAGHPEAALSPASSASVAMNHGAAASISARVDRVGAARCRTQRHDGGQVAEFLTEQEGVKLPLRDDQRAAGLDGIGVRDRSAGRSRNASAYFGFAPLGLADLHQRQPVPVEPRDDHPSGLISSGPPPGSGSHDRASTRGGRP